MSSSLGIVSIIKLIDNYGPNQLLSVQGINSSSCIQSNQIQLHPIVFNSRNPQNNKKPRGVKSSRWGQTREIGRSHW